MKVITISRLLSSGGQTIGRQVADELGYSFVTKKTIEKVMKQYGMVDFAKVYESSPGFLDRMDDFQEDMITMLRKILQAIGALGSAVIVGRGSFAVFPNYSDVLNVRLWAPLDVRVDRFMNDRNLTDRKKAKDMVENADRIRKGFVERWFHGYPDRSHVFDLVINTAKIAQENSVRLIVDTARNQKDLELREYNTLESLTVDKILLQTVEKVLQSES
jgi:cytidylate kinase